MNLRPLAKPLFGTLLALLITQAGCQRSNSGAGTGASSITSDMAPPGEYTFEKPVRIMAGGEPVSVEAPGYACPTLADIDGDGKEDLIVGQFRDGNMQFFRNIAATGQVPEFATAEWIMTGKERAVVPGVW